MTDTENKTGAAAASAAGGQQNQADKAPAAADAAKAGGKPAAGAEQTLTVPINVVTAMRDELKELKSRNDQLNQQVNLYQANTMMANQMHPQAQPSNAAAVLTSGRFTTCLWIWSK